MATNQTEEEDHSSSPSTSEKDKTIKESSDNAKVSAPPPKFSDSNSSNDTPSSKSPTPPLKKSQSPPPPKKSSAPPPSPPPSSPKKSSASPPPPSPKKPSASPPPPSPKKSSASPPPPSPKKSSASPPPPSPKKSSASPPSPSPSSPPSPSPSSPLSPSLPASPSPSPQSEPVRGNRPSSPPPPYYPRKQSSAPRPPAQHIKPSNGKHGVASRATDSTNSSTSSSPATSSSGSDDNAGKNVGYTLAAVIFAVALVALAVALVFTVKKKKSRVDRDPLYVTPPYLRALNICLKSGANGHYYVQQPTQSPSLAKNLGNPKANMNHLGTSFDSPKFASVQIVFTFEMVMEMTNAFSSQNVIGEGGFGCVFKGCLPDGKTVAVKQLKAGSGQGEREFKSEVEIISRVHHRHLVSLVGYCIFEHQRILIYEYVPNGTLHHHLHGSGIPVLDWVKRLKIAIGAAKGLAYLHEDCSQKIIHRDIKSANILLDHAYEAQVADFGLAKLADAANSHVSTRVMGTFGYMAPEYATSGKLTDRSDVYSFGVVLLELVTGRKPVDQTQPLGDESLVEWARPLLPRAIETRNFSDLIDPRLEKHFVESEMLRMIEAAAACVRYSAPNRPRMVQVVRALDCGNESDLSNGVKYGHSTVYDSGQYNKEIMLFRRLANGTFVDSDFEMLSSENSFPRDISMTSRGSQQELIPHSSTGESASRSITRQGASSIG